MVRPLPRLGKFTNPAALPDNLQSTEGKSKFYMLSCPLCDSPDWSSVQKNKDGVNLQVQCENCEYVYQTRFRSESLEYRLASAFSHGHIWQESFTAYGMETGEWRVGAFNRPQISAGMVRFLMIAAPWLPLRIEISPQERRVPLFE